jgi:glucose/arabinose dehydrogenase
MVLLGIALLALSLVTPALTNAAPAFDISLTRIAQGFSFPTQVTNAGDGSGRLFVVEKRGTVRVVVGNSIQSGYFMDIRSLVSESGERGLLSIAFHPDFETNRTLFAFYTRNDGDLVVTRLRTNPAGTNVSETTRAPLLLIEHSRNSNHNGGSLAFGPDGYLYVGTGDGGGSGDPFRAAQYKGSLLGKILRIDVDGTGDGPFDRYRNPSTNPYEGSASGLDEIWARGLRNPWRISFDRGTGALFIADVGQGRREEVNREPAGFAGGRNYGWSAMEGSVCYRPSKCPLAGDTLPVTEYGHSSGNCSITGGYVYRGTDYPAMVGQYVFADFCTGMIWTIDHSGTGGKSLRYDSQQSPTSFGESDDGEL